MFWNFAAVLLIIGGIISYINFKNPIIFTIGVLLMLYQTRPVTPEENQPKKYY
jgi:hypothetical protein